ncbi:acyl-CoA thioesterase-1 [Alteromonadaceae bacterium Bs31]|nr:acyl-CoA thioesterase-1 [Alteromonadaceae bacterium Bs31]
MFYKVLIRWFVFGTVLWASVTSAFAETHKEKVLLVVGDSLSAAYNLAEEQGWVHLLAERLSSHKNPHFASYKVVNASAGGATSAAALQALPPLLEQYKPSLVILAMGANDGLQGKPVPYITNNLRSLIEHSKSAGAEVMLTGIRLPPNFGKRYTEPFFNQYGQLAKEYQLALVPFLLEGVAGNNQLMQADRLHPTAEAQAIILETVWQTLEGMM